MYLASMRYYRTTSTGRRISAEPRVRKEPDMKRLVALVLHLADQLHAEEAQHRAGDAGDDHDHHGPAAVTGERGNEDDDTPGIRTRD